MGSLLAFLVIASVAFLVVRIGTTALTMTGVSREAASFQACSAFFGVGFTTTEAEMVINHPVRRRIIRDLIVAGNLGITSTIATVMVTFVQRRETMETLQILGLLILIGVAVALFFKLGFVSRALDWAIRQTLERFSSVKARDYEMLLRVEAGFCVSEQEIHEDHRLVGHALGVSRPADAGVIVLGIHRQDGTFLGAPSAFDVPQDGDVAILYGTEEAIGEMAKAAKQGTTAGDSP